MGKFEAYDMSILAGSRKTSPSKKKQPRKRGNGRHILSSLTMEPLLGSISDVVLKTDFD